MSGLERLSIEACQVGAVFWEAIAVLQLLGVARGLALVWVGILNSREMEAERLGSVNSEVAFNDALNSFIRS